VSFNGGTGGTTAKPTPQELSAAHENHVAPTALQTQHEHAARSNRALFASVNHGAPSIAATAKPGVFTGHGITATKGVKVNHTPGAAGGLANGAPQPGAHTTPKDHAAFNGAKNPGNTAAFNGTKKPGNTAAFNGTKKPVNTAALKNGGPPGPPRGAMDHKARTPNQMHANLGPQHKAPAPHGPPPHHPEQHVHTAPKKSGKPERQS